MTSCFLLLNARELHFLFIHRFRRLMTWTLMYWMFFLFKMRDNAGDNRSDKSIQGSAYYQMQRQETDQQQDVGSIYRTAASCDQDSANLSTTVNHFNRYRNTCNMF